jgi:hypothetical protein
MNNATVNFAIPATGRLAQKSLKWLAEEGIVEAAWADMVIKAIGSIRKVEDEQQATLEVEKLWAEGLEGVTLKYDARSGWRAAFSAKKVKLDNGYAELFGREAEGSTLTLYGANWPAVSGIMEGVTDLALIGFDDLLVAMLPYVNPQYGAVKDWNELNQAIFPKNSTDARVICSAPFEDYGGMFLIASPRIGLNTNSLERLVDGKIPLYMKGRYEGLAYYFLGDKVNVYSTERIEDALDKTECFALDMVSTGNTLTECGYQLLGKPLLYTRPVLVADIKKYSNNRDIRDFVGKSVANNKFWRPDSTDDIQIWQNSLRQKLGPQWRSGL